MSAQQNNRLGRGLDALIPTTIDEFVPDSMPDDVKIDKAEITEISPDSIEANPYQPRKNFDEESLTELTKSIEQHGIVQPLVVVETSPGKYELIAGERRLRAARLAGLERVPTIVRSHNQQEQLEIAVIENIQRADLNPLELAAAYQKLSDQFNLSVKQIAKRVGKADSTVNNILRLLNLPHEVKLALRKGFIVEGHARAILSVTNTAQQHFMLTKIIKDGLTVRQAEELARNYKEHGEIANPKLKEREQYNTGLKRDLAKYLGTKVDIQKTAKGGKLVIEFYSEEELSRIYDQITSSEKS